MTRQAIQEVAAQREIPYILHFTRATNLPSIMQHGVYPIGRAGEIGINPAINDALRLDGHRNSTSVSIGFPNCQMFWKYRKESPGVEWTVLVLDPAILWQKSCAFCRHNAADARISHLPIELLMNPQAFRGMFEEIEGVTSRADQELKSFDPTDVQAEVLVFDVIEPQYINGVIFESTAVRDTYTPHIQERKTYLHANNKGMFASRNYARKYQ